MFHFDISLFVWTMWITNISYFWFFCSQVSLEFQMYSHIYGIMKFACFED